MILGREHYVVFCDLDASRLESALNELKLLGIDGEAIACDISDWGAVTALAAQAGSIGPVVAVVHTTGVSPRMADARTIMTINALGTIHDKEAFLAIAEEGFAW